MRRRRVILSLVSALYFGVVIGLAFVPTSGENRTTWFWPIATFVPVGILLVLLLGPRRWWAAIAFGALGAAWIEAAQSVWMPVGFAQAMDVVWGGLGASIGVVAAAILTSQRRRVVASDDSHRIVAHAGSREIPQD